MTTSNPSTAHLLVYKIACLVAVIAILVDGYLADQRRDFPELVLQLRVLVTALTTVAFIVISQSKTAQKFAGELLLLCTTVAYIYAAEACNATNQSVDEVLGSVLLLCASATIFHRISLVVAAMVTGCFIYLFYSLQLSEPNVGFEKFAMTVIVFAIFFSVMVSTNINARRKQSQSEQVANAWFDSAADALIRTTVIKEAPFMVNAAARKMFGTSDPNQIVDCILASFLQDRQTERSRDMWLESAISLEELDEILEFKTIDGQKFWGDMSLRRIRIGDEPLTLTRISDVTNRVKHDQALEAAIEEAEKAVHTRTRFLANMSHEIRTPMNGVIGMTSLLLDTRLDDQQKSFLDTIRMSGDSLLSIINEILDFSKIDADQIELEEVRFDLQNCVVDALNIIGPAAREKNLELIIGMDATQPCWFMGDVSRIRQVLVNLLSNAVKFTATGSISLQVKIETCSKLDSSVPESFGQDPSRISFDIVDTGVGIDASKQANLFDPFTQADSSTTRKFGGTGLGLTISKRLAKLMGGDVTVRSHPGRGSCFTFSCNLMSAKPESQPVNVESLKGKRLLLVCSRAARQLCEYCLDGLAMQVTSVDIEQAGVSLDGKQEFDLVVIDANTQLPEQLSETLRNAGIHAPALVVSPLGSRQPDPSKYTRVVSKPLRPDELVTAMIDTLAGRSGPSKSARSTSLPALNLRNISFLLAEDNIVNQKVALNMFKRLGIRADAVGNGKEAIEILHQRHYDVVFMDVQMPEIDGLEASVLIRQSPELEQPYIIAMTANAMREDRDNCLQAGMNDHIAKPVRLQDVHRSVAVALDSLAPDR